MLADMHPKFVKYQEANASHEAGFDSYQTARIMILLSAKLHADERCAAMDPPRQKGKNRLSSASKVTADSFPVIMPSFEDPFWKEYGNRLRVFGTAESFMELSPNREKRLPILTADGN